MSIIYQNCICAIINTAITAEWNIQMPVKAANGNKRPNSLFILVFLTLLAGCSGLKTSHTEVEVTSAKTTVSKRSIGDTIALLEQGDDKTAKQSLLYLLSTDPDDKTAKRLLSQIIEDPVKRYGSDYFNYTVKPGESFALLAKRYLGHSLEFYGLSRYNNINNPSSIYAGQIVRIPKSKQYPAPDSITQKIQTLKKLLDSHQHTAALTLAFQGTPILQNTAKNRQLINRTLQQYMESLTTPEQLVNAESTLSSYIHPSNPYNTAIKRTIKAISYRLLLSQSHASTLQKDYDSAYQLIIKAKGLKQKQTALAKTIINSITEAYHRTAVLYFRDQDLERAIHLWDKILKIDPEHESAKIYRSRATELNLRLKNLQ